MKIYKITEASEYLGVSINTLKTLANKDRMIDLKIAVESINAIVESTKEKIRQIEKEALQEINDIVNEALPGKYRKS